MSEAAGSTQRRHVAVLAFPFGTHAAPLLDLVRRLSEAALEEEVTFSFFSTAQSNGSLFMEKDELRDCKIVPYNVESGLPEGFGFTGNPREPVEHFLKATPGNFVRALEKAVAKTGLEISCLITDAFLWFAAEMAEEMRVPWIAYWTAGPRSLLAHVDSDIIREIIGVNGPENQTLESIPGFSSIRAKDLPEGIISGPLDSPFPIMLDKMGKTLPKATVVAINSYEELDPIVVETLKSRFRKFLNVGPSTLTSPPPVSDPHGCLPWLNEHENASVIYISFGSMITPPRAEVIALAEALEAIGFPFLWSFRGNAEEQLPKGFLERTKSYGKVVPWAPQLKILEHSSVCVFVTHCGWNSTIEGITGGVPMVCRPVFGDQALNQRIIETAWGIGVGVEGEKFTKDETVNALKQVLSSEEGKRMGENVGALKKLAFKAAESDGSSTKNFKALVEVVNMTCISMDNDTATNTYINLFCTN